MGGQMVTIKDAAEANYIASLIKGNTYYLGLSRLGQEPNETYAWADGDKPEFYNWEYGHHDQVNTSKDHNCVNLLASSGQWKDAQCTKKLNLLCEMKATTQDIDKLKNETDALTEKVETIIEEVKVIKTDVEKLKKDVIENKK
ncbi:low affinity immunoglobulin epsilon Fc receptor-like protein, partial [Leptotrombidium deliense]